MNKENKIIWVEIDEEGKVITRTWSDGTKTTEELEHKFSEWGIEDINNKINKESIPIGIRIYQIEQSIKSRKNSLIFNAEWDARKIKAQADLGIDESVTEEEMTKIRDELISQEAELKEKQREIGAKRSVLSDIAFRKGIYGKF